MRASAFCSKIIALAIESPEVQLRSSSPHYYSIGRGTRMRFNTPYQPNMEMVGVFTPLATNDKKIVLNNLLRNGKAH